MQSLIKRLPGSRSQLDICGLHGGSAALFLAGIVAAHHRSVCCIVPADEELEILAQDLRLFSGAEVLVYPSFEIPPYTPLSPDPATIALRLATLHRLLNNAEPCIVLSSAEAVLRRLPPKSALGRHSELVMAGEETDREALIRSLIDAGYQMCSMVQHESDLAVRGGIIDIYAPSPDPAVQGPLRLDFFGDTIDSIRLFEPISQRSVAELPEAILLPATDILFPAPERNQAWRDFLKKTTAALGWPRDKADHLLMQLGEHIRFAGIEFFLPLLFPEPDPVQTLFDYLPADSIIAFHDPAAVNQQVNLLQDRILANHDEALQKDAAVLPPDHLFLDRLELDRLAARFPVLNLRPLPNPDASHETLTLTTGDHTLLRQEIELQRKKRGTLAPLVDRLMTWTGSNDTVILACRSARQAHHLEQMLAAYQIASAPAATPLDFTNFRDRPPDPPR